MAAVDSPSLLALPVRPRTWRGVRSSDDWRTSLLVLLALLVTMPGLHTILVGTDWVVHLGLVCVLVIGVAGFTRMLSRLTLLPPIVAGAAFLVTMTAYFAPGTAFLAVIPTPGTFAAFGDVLQGAAVSINQQALPARADVGITFVMCLGIAAIALVADVAALSLRAPALVGIPLVVLVAVPPYIQPNHADPATFVLAALAYLLLLRVGSRRGQGGLSVALGSAIVALSLVVSFVLPSAGDYKTNDASGAFGTGVNPVLSLGNDLRQGTNRTVLTYSTNSGAPHYLRLVSIVDFSGSNWAPDSFASNSKNTVDRIAAAPGLSPAVQTVQGSTTVRVADLTSQWLPLSYPTSSVTGLSGDWLWDTEGHAVSSIDRTSAGQHYTATDLSAMPTPAQLQASGTTVPAGMERYLAVPKGLPAVVASTAHSVVGTASTNYEKALLLQTYFHDGEFQYSETAPVSKGYDGTGGQVIARFLTTKAGYCIHFASTMAMMARTLGIPARISVGFLPGHAVSGSGSARKYQVDAHDLHAWPELFFAGIGWTRFEPTVSRGDTPSYASSVDASTAGPSAGIGATPDGAAVRSKVPVAPTAVAPTGGAIADSPRVASRDTAAWQWIVLVLLLGTLVSVVPAAIRLLQRRRRLAAGSVLPAWLEVMQSAADVGRSPGEALTPREAAVRLAISAPELGPLLDSLEREQFGSGKLLRRESTGDAEAVIAALFASVPLATRIRGRLYPPSLWRRILRR